MRPVMLPTGIDSFERIRNEGFYYIDKTGLISELLKKAFDVQLITRPRRFGKTLGLRMLSDFFDIQKDSHALFAGMEVSREPELCSKWMNQWPVLFVSLKDVEGLEFDYAYEQLQIIISDCCAELNYLLGSDKVSEFDKEVFRRLAAKTGSPAEVSNSIFLMTRMLYSHFGRPVIVLIDEYDVPLAKASEHGYYDKMLQILRGLMGKALKTNQYLKFSVVTGCLRIVKESIFMGTNNLVTDTISGERFSEFFGFTENDVLKLLDDTGFCDHAGEIKRWYDGYHFGNTDIYCPWDVLNHVSRLQDRPDANPENYWKNTSHNNIIRSFLGRTDLAVNDKFEKLLAGESISQKITESLTYDVLHSDEENIWTILYLTGYLTQNGEENGQILLGIPNEEVKSIFAETVAAWFKEAVVPKGRKELFNALWKEDAERVTSLLSDLLFETISYHDYAESYYHAFLAGIFSGAGYPVISNYESGLGRPDIVVLDKINRRAIIIEAKRAQAEDQLEAQCDTALKQITDKQYSRNYLKGFRQIICYGIAFFEKECMVKKG